jgi:bifunctional UDP-N-acetylglucosamine pyrophosphorylase / glucosamine-1-phosphate N-acetyltransferase
MALNVVILAAGNGKRMHSKLPKVLHPLGGIPLLLHVVKTAQSLHPERIYIVHGCGNEEVKRHLTHLQVTWVLQGEPKGTGHALYQALPLINDEERVLVLYGDVPLIKTSTLQHLLTTTQQNPLGLLVACLEDPTNFGRIIRDDRNTICQIVEHREATPQQLLIKEINTGILTASSSALKKWLPQLKDKNTQAEYYLTDIISIAVKEGVQIVDILASCNKEISGVNDRRELMVLERHYQVQKAYELLMQGVLIIDPQRFDCRGNLTLGKDVQIDVNVILEGEVTIGEGSIIGPDTVLKNVHIGKNVTIKSHCVIEDAVIKDGCVVGPFAHIRPHTELKEGVHVGNFVELKNATIGSHSKVNHVTYLGDTHMGEKVNVGAGTITCNYDGHHKHFTEIEDGAFIGSGTELVAPIRVGKNAYIGAGSTITRDVPKELLTLARTRQITVKEWKKKSSL